MNDISIFLIIFVCFLFLIAIISSRRVKTNEDFLVGARRFGLWTTTFSLFATWFGAGTLIISTDEIAQTNLLPAFAEPIGAGFCLIFAGLFFAKKLWQMKITTFADFFKIHYGRKMENISTLITLLVFIGWVAVQYIALSQIIASLTPLTQTQSLFAITILTGLLTSLGGIWSVGITDSVQVLFIVIGVVYLFFKVCFSIDLDSVMSEVSSSLYISSLKLPMQEKIIGIYTGLSLFCFSSLGNLTGQDLGSRIFSAKSDRIALRACLISGFMYLTLGLIPIFFGLSANLIINKDSSVITTLISNFLGPLSSKLVLLTLISVIVSTITSAILAPASVLSHNFLKNIFIKTNSLLISKLSVWFITLLSLFLALIGENAFNILEKTYELGLISLFPVFLLAFKDSSLCKQSAFVMTITNMSLWTLSLIFFPSISTGIFLTLLSFPLYYTLKKVNNIKRINR